MLSQTLPTHWWVGRNRRRGYGVALGCSRPGTRPWSSTHCRKVCRVGSSAGTASSSARQVCIWSSVQSTGTGPTHASHPSSRAWIWSGVRPASASGTGSGMIGGSLGLGVSVGASVGVGVGSDVGLLVGLEVGSSVGVAVGLAVGSDVGLLVGLEVGPG